MDKAERLYSGAEIRASGRTLEGTAMRFGDVSPSHKERFAPGSIDLSDGVQRWLNLAHDHSRVLAWTAGGGLELRTTGFGLEVRAELPRTPLHDFALRGVEGGKFRGLSVEFHSHGEHEENGVRVIEKALLNGIGLVSAPSYPGSTVEARAEIRAAGVKGEILYGAALACRCHPGSANVVKFEVGAFRESIRTRNVIAIAGQYAQAVASTAKGTLTLTDTARGLRIAIARLPDTQVARDLVEQAAVVPITMRPVYRVEDDADFTEENGIATYRKATLRAILLGTTDEDDGFQEAEFVEPDTPVRRSARRLWL